MQFELQVGNNPLEEAVDAIICPCFEGAGIPPALTGAAEEFELPEISWVLADGEFDGRKGQMTLLHTGGRTTAKRILLTGLGPRPAASVRALRDLVADAMRRLRDVGCARVLFLLPDDACGLTARECIAAVTEASYLGLYTFTRYKTGKVAAPEDVPARPDPELVVLWLAGDAVDLAGGAEAVMEAIELGEALARAANVTKDICNEPANVMTPRELTKECLAAVGAGDDFSFEVLAEREIREHRMGLIEAVSRGAGEPPRVVLVCYRGNPGDPRYWGIVGKGVTFDSGGISRNGTRGAFELKRDVTGAGTVVGLMDAMRRLRPPVNVAGLIVSAENMPDAAAFKPGDIYTSMSGKTVEIHSTHAEGRLLLADGLTFLQRRLDLHGLITIATLTGAALAAVGPSITPVLGRPRALIEALQNAGERSGERFWELPMDDDYMPRVKSHFADIKSDSPKPPATIAGAMFIREFIEPDTPWLHLDIAATSSADQPSGIISRGATGVAVRSLLRFLLDPPDNL